MGVELRHRRTSGCLAQNLVGLAKLTVLPFESLQFPGHFARVAKPGAIIHFRLMPHSLSVCAVQRILATTEDTAAQGPSPLVRGRKVVCADHIIALVIQPCVALSCGCQTIRHVRRELRAMLSEVS